MKKIYFLLFALIAGSSAFAQTVANAGMETWRTGSAGTYTVIPIQAPTQWYGIDSLIISDLETYAPLFLMDTPMNLHAQIYKENTIIHSGSHSAKLITLKQDTLGRFPGTFANSLTNVDVFALAAGAPLSTAISYTGGTPITGRIASVSAWVQYMPGLDSITGLPGGIDSGTFTVNIYSQVHGIDSLVGTALVKIPPTATWTQVTANVVYADSLDGADTARIIFASSGFTGALDSSTLYVDDVSMVYAPPLTGVKNVTASEVKIYPNPASGMLYMNGQENAGSNFRLFSINGQLVADKILTGTDTIDIAALPDGLYFYTVTDINGNITQRGKVSVVK